MSTRSRIGIAQDDGTVKSIYCHWDGYPSNNGKILLDHYTDRTKVESLIALGDISALEAEVAPTEELAPGRYSDTKKPVRHSFDTPQENVTIAYARDRGEDFEEVKPRIDESVAAFEKSDLEEWGYLFKDGKWLVKGCCDKKFVPLTEKFCLERG